MFILLGLTCDVLICSNSALLASSRSVFNAIKGTGFLLDLIRERRVKSCTTCLFCLALPVMF